MKGDTNSHPNRRRYLKTLGAVGGVGVTSLAGCQGRSGQSTGQTTAGTLEGCSEVKGTLSTVFFPISEIFITHKRMATTDLYDELNDVCWRGDFDYQFDDLPGFVSGDFNMSNGGPLEASNIAEKVGAEEIVIWDRNTSAFTGVFAKAGGEYDPEVTGGAQQSVDKMIENDDNFGIFSWGSGNTIPNQIIMEKVFGYEMRQDGGDVNVVTAETGAVPELLKNDELALATSSPAHGGGRYIYNDDIVPVWWDNQIMPENGLGLPNFANHWSTRELFDDPDYKQAIGAFMRSHQNAKHWFYNEAPDVVPGSSKYEGAFANAEEEEVVQWIMDWLTAHERGIVDDVKHANAAPSNWKSVYITDEYIEKNNSYAEAGVDIGIVPEDWDEKMSWEKFRPPQGTDDLPITPP